MVTGLYRLRKSRRPMPEIFKAVDANKDGKVTLDEIQMFFRGGSASDH